MWKIKYTTPKSPVVKTYVAKDNPTKEDVIMLLEGYFNARIKEVRFDAQNGSSETEPFGCGLVFEIA